MAKKIKKITTKEAMGTFLTNMEDDEFTKAENILEKVIKGKVRNNVNREKAKLFKPISK